MQDSETTILKARWLWTADAPLVSDAAVAFGQGRILAVGASRRVQEAYPDATFHDLGSSIILPGLVNAHTHLELSDCTRAEVPPQRFIDWIIQMREKAISRQPEPSTTISPSTRAGVAQCLRFGITCVGDISSFFEITRPILRESPIRAVSFGEVLGIGAIRERFQSRLAPAIDRSMQCERLKIGLSPHAPYTVDIPGYLECVELARQDQLPLATHLAETRDEQSFLREFSGEFVELWRRLNGLPETVDLFDGTPVQLADLVRLTQLHAVLAHVNYCSDADLDLLANGNASVVYCPRTHQYFKHRPHRWREMLARGINLAVGTDSCATSPDLNLVDDLRLLHQIAPDFPVEDLWRLATLRGAIALRLDHEIGSLIAPKRADFAVFPVESDDPLREILESDTVPTQVFIDGQSLL